MDFKALNEFQDNLRNVGIAGNDLAIYKDFKPVYRYMTGFQDIEKDIPTSRSTMYKMFSMTKPITCVAALQLYEKGAFMLTDKVGIYLPSFAKFPTMEVRHLFTMTAGLNYNRETPALKELYRKTDCRFTTEQFVDAIAQGELDYQPGEHWKYSLAHDVLARLVEIWSGMRFADYVKKYITDPLDMNDTTFHASEEQSSRYMQSYVLRDGKFVLSSQENSYQLSPNHDSGGAGISSTVDDYAKFACMMTNLGIGETGAKILTSRTVNLMRMNHLTPVQYEDLYNSSEHRRGYGYGLGVRTMVDKAASGSPSPVGEFGWSGAWGTATLFDPENRITMVYAQQSVEPHAIFIKRRVRNLSYFALETEGVI